MGTIFLKQLVLYKKASIQDKQVVICSTTESFKIQHILQFKLKTTDYFSQQPKKIPTRSSSGRKDLLWFQILQWHWLWQDQMLFVLLGTGGSLYISKNKRSSGPSPEVHLPF